jgi:hypothetical protein
MDTLNIYNQPDRVEQSEKYHWHRQTIAETFARIVIEPAFPWVAIGDFLDDWRQSAREDRLDLVAMDIPDTDVIQDNLELRRWAAFCAAMVEWLCWRDQLPFPPWTNRAEYRLSEPWFLYPGDLLRAWQLATTPAPFKMRNIFGGDQILDRV